MIRANSADHYQTAALDQGLHCLLFQLNLFDEIHKGLTSFEHRHIKLTFCILCENKDADQLRGNGEADQGLCFRYMDSKIPLLSKSEILSL